MYHFFLYHFFTIFIGSYFLPLTSQLYFLSSFVLNYFFEFFKLDKLFRFIFSLNLTVKCYAVYLIFNVDILVFGQKGWSPFIIYTIYFLPIFWQPYCVYIVTFFLYLHTYFDFSSIFNGHI